MSDILGEIVPDMRLKRRSLSMRVSDEERREREGLYRCSS